MEPAIQRKLVDHLLAWFDRRARSLPWRDNPSPYHVLVSEFMLQQTQVATVIPYYERFIRRFPSLAHLAAAPEEEVLKLWEGLGYYRRARHLHRLAQHVVEEGGGELPATVEELRELPGVGPYTAGAVASIAFGRREPAIDGNVQRVLARLFHIQEPVDRAVGRTRLERAARALLAHTPPGRAGDFNQALMELGSLVCSPAKPDCGGCPLAAFCAAREAGAPEELPRRRATPGPPREEAVAALLVCRGSDARDWGERVRHGRVLLVRRPATALLGGMWGLPTVAPAIEEAGLPLLCRVEHVFSHRRWRMRVYGMGFPEGGFPTAGAEEAAQEVGEWVRRTAGAEPDLGEGEPCWAGRHERSLLAIPRPFRRALEIIEGAGD